MRRFIGYIIVAATMLISCLALFIPAVNGLNLGSEFRSGHEFVYEVYNQDDQDIEVTMEEIDQIADIFRGRMNQAGINDYKVNIEGTDTLRLTFAAPDYKYNFISRYVNFSPDLTICTTSDVCALGSNVFTPGLSDVSLTNNEGIPTVLIPVNKDLPEWTAVFDEAVKIAGENPPPADGEAANPDAQSTNLLIWNNRQESDTYERAKSGNDPEMAERVFLQIPFGTGIKGENLYFYGTDDNHLQVLPTGFSLTGIGGQDAATHPTFAVEMISNMLKAERFEINGTPYNIKLKYNGTGNYIPPTSEDLISLGTFRLPAFSNTLIAFIVSFVIMCAVFVAFYRLSTVAAGVMSLSSAFFTFALFAIFSIEFNIAAIVGLIVTLSISFIMQALYLNRLKKEVKNGKSLKKANAQASKDVLMPTIDIAIIQVVAGIIFFALGGTFLLPFGVIMMVGGAFNAIFNIFGMRLMMWLLTNNTKFQDKPKLLGIDVESATSDSSSIPEPEVVSPAMAKKTKKRFKLSALITGVVALASIAGISVFAGLNGGNALNNGGMAVENSRLYFEVQEEHSPIADILSVQEILNSITLDDENDEAADAKLAYSSVLEYSKKGYDTSDETETFEYTIKYYVVTLDSHYDGSEMVTYKTPTDEISASLDSVLATVVLELDDTAAVALKTVRAVPGQPVTGTILLAFLLASLISSVWTAIRYRPSRGLVSFGISAITGLIPLGILALTRIPVAPIVLVSAVVASVIAQVLSLIFLSGERSYIKDLKVRRLTSSQKEDSMLKATNDFLSVGIIPLITVAMALFTFAFIAPTTYAIFFAVSLVGVVLGAALIFLLLGYLSLYLNKGFTFALAKLPKPKERVRKKNRNAPAKSAEPQEAIFIGINDFR